MRQWGRRAEEQRVPLSGTIELTRRCNLRCIHCYVGEQDEQWRRREDELTTADWLSILDQVTAAGCLYLLITGGEPLLRPDFPEIYRRAKGNGLLVTVFSNGTTLADNMLALFTELPPLQVEITLYGASAGVYEGITGVPGSYARCLAGIEGLARAGVRFALKTMLMTRNRHEFAAIEELARGYGVKFRFDAAIHPRFDGDRAPLDLRVSPAEVVAADFADDEKTGKWREFYGRFGGGTPSDLLYQCGAGLTGFHVDPFGRLQLCLMAPEPGCDLRHDTFSEGWQGAVPRTRARKAPANYRCLACEVRALCGYCPGFFRLENGSEEVASEFLCSLGRQRLAALSGPS